MLGGFDVRLNGRSVAGVSYNRMRALLAYLAMERKQDHNREVLAELLWSGNDPVTARGNLRRTLSDLRRVLELPSGKVLFSASKQTIRFIPNAYIDVLEFTAAAPSCVAPTPVHCDPCIAQMEHMVGLYRGEFMEGFSLPDCAEFEDWLQIQREALHRRALTLLERLSNCLEQADSYGMALPFALRYTELEPWDEAGHRRVMRLYALNGQNSAALGQYDFCRRMLQKELNVLSNRETRGLAESIRKGEWRAERSGTTGEPPIKILPPLTAERRQVTVLYCELTLAAIDDPDEAMELLRTPRLTARKSSGSFPGISCKRMAAACWPISVTRKPTNTLPAMPYRQRWPSRIKPPTALRFAQVCIPDLSSLAVSHPCRTPPAELPVSPSSYARVPDMARW